MNKFENKSLAITMIENDHSAIMIFGKIKKLNNNWYLDRGDDSAFPLSEDFLNRIRPVNVELKEVAEGSDYILVLSVENLPTNVDKNGLISTGINWYNFN